MHKAPKNDILTFHLSKRIDGTTFILSKNVILELFDKAAVTTLVEINFGRKKNNNQY